MEEKKIETAQETIIRQPNLYLYAGIGCAVVFFAVALLAFSIPESRVVGDFGLAERLTLGCFLSAVSIACSFIIILQVNWKITIEKDRFIYQNMFRKKKIYKFDEVEIKLFNASHRIYKNKKWIISISYLQENYDALRRAIRIYKRKNLCACGRYHKSLYFI